jgi:uncharacterized membrane protein YhaH (DUF805 family)
MEQEKPITKDSRSSSEKPIIEEMYVTQKDEPAIEPKHKNNIFSFKGRATRTEYWLVTFICNFVAIPANKDIEMSTLVTILYCIVMLAALWVYIATMVRRCHDRGKSWWFIFIPLYFLLLYVLPAQQEGNEFGPNPRDKKTDD